jgi:AcrR family transcriptional regulator
MRARLLAAARALFITNGFGATSTPMIVAAAGVTRGALYHHFPDKVALFRAVAEAEAEAVADAVEVSGDALDTALERLRAGAFVWLDAMAQSGRARILLVDAPAVLGADFMQALEARTGERTLEQGLRAAMDTGEIAALPITPLLSLLSAMFDRAALLNLSGASQQETRQVIALVLQGLARSRA